MAKEFKLKADFGALLKGLEIQKQLNKAIKISHKLWQDAIKFNTAYEKQSKNINEAIKKRVALEKQLTKEGASPLRKKVELGKATFDIMKTKAANPFPTLISWAGKFGKVLMAIGKVGWLLLLTAAITIFTKMWNMNIGGIQKSAFAVWGRIQNAIGKVIQAFVKFVEKVGPIVEPFFKALEAVIMPLIEQIEGMFTSFLEGGAAVDIFKGAIMPIMNGVLQLFQTIIPIIQKFIKNLFSAGPTGKSAFGELFKILGKVLGTIFKLVAAIFKVLDAIHFWDAVVFIIKLIVAGLTVVLDVIEKIIAGIIKAVEWFAKLFKSKEKIKKQTEDEKAAEAKKAETVKASAASQAEAMRQYQINQSRTTTINNSPVVTVHSSGPISDKSAPMIGDVLAKSVQMQRGVM